MLSARIAKSGLSRQTAKGTANAVATYGMGLLDGNVFQVPIEQEPEEITSDKWVNPGANRLGVRGAADFTSRLYPRIAPLLFVGALGDVVTTGAAAPYTHTITPGDILPWLTLHARYTSDYYRITDCRVDKLALSWDGPGPIECAVSLLGITPEFQAAAFTITNDELDSGGKFRGAGGTFQLDVDSATPATAPISAGEIAFSNNLTAEPLASSIKPDDILRTVLVPSFSLTLKPNDLLRFREIVTGSAGGTTISDVPIYGSANVKFVHDANTDVTITATRIPWTADFPDVAPSGGVVQLTLNGDAMQADTGSAITVVCRNSIASYA